MSANRWLKAAIGSMAFMILISGCNTDETKPVEEDEKTEATEETEEEKKAEQERIAKEEAEAERIAKEEAEAKAKAEAEAKAKEEAQAKAKAEAEAQAKAEEEAEAQAQRDPANMGAVEKAQWENSNFADVHERANYLNAHMNHFDNISSDEQTKSYLNALNDDLQTSGEMQTEALLNGEMEAAQ